MSYLQHVAIPPYHSGERRRHRRIQVMLSVTLAEGTRQAVARVSELSSHGLRLSSTIEFSEGEQVSVTRGDVTLSGRVAWRRDNIMGVQLDMAVDEHSFLRFRREKHLCPLCRQIV
jgi:hypothetical protein